MTDISKNPAVLAAKDESKQDEIKILSTGIRAKILPVSASLIQEVTTRIKSPKIPMWHNENKNRDEPNPADPDYIAECENANTKRGQAAMDAMIMFGVELVDELPNDKNWIKKLNFIGIKVNEDDNFELEFAYKKYIAVGNIDLMMVGKTTGISQEAISQAAESFQR